MAFNGAFTIGLGTDPTSFTLNDTSTGSDTNLTDRRIFLYKADGTTLVPVGSPTTYIDWPLSAGASITITGLIAQDYCLNIEVDWISSSPLAPPSTYTLTILTAFTGNSEQFNGTLIQMQATNPLLVNDNKWFENASKLRQYIENAVNAANPMNNIGLSQSSLNLAYQLIQNATTYFQQWQQ